MKKILFVWKKILPLPCWCFLIVSHWLFFSQKSLKKKHRARWKEQEDLEILGDNQFVAANRGKLPFSANTIRLTTQNENKKVEEVFMFSSEALFANLPHSLISKAIRYLKMKIHCLRKIKECFLFNSYNWHQSMRGDDSPTECNVAFGLLSPVHEAFVYVFTILNSAQVSIRW